MEMKVLSWVSRKPSQRQGLGAKSPFGRSQGTGAREWGSDTKIRLPHCASREPMKVFGIGPQKGRRLGLGGLGGPRGG